ncbi:aminoglycoside phosphotransferase family protein [Actinoplanes sp. LDG1-06]|uniref:Aminoglycoside phosphotransferase family protein n=1 Tax=Paractinoplanes ovalisporus TaxID=2810368 RepID=A0ABS2A758_9ACTN|nr:aminoglycoside phosphotransferase family protein [Actinoplanes ovalisporus]MBM2615617.1 aminoglycoside phosphotransferase family protein [Actinoplanes ovalisporus]
MESLTKNRQPIGTLRALVGRAFGEARVPDGDGWVHELGHGWFNVAYRIRLRDGHQIVLKIAPPPGVEVMTYERGAMATELAALELVRSRTSVPVPAVEFADTSHELIDADWFVMPFVDADNYGIIRPTLSAHEQDGYDAALGAATRELNSIRGEAFGPLGGPGVATWREQFLGMVEAVLGDGERREVDLGHDYDAVRDVVAANAGCLTAVTEPRFVEWDLWDSNVLVRDGRIVCVIDHERAFFGDPLIEAGFVATQLRSFGDPTAFVRGYGRRGSTSFTSNERRRRRLYNLHLTLVMVIETVYRGHTDTRQYAWARERLTETLAQFGSAPAS